MVNKGVLALAGIVGACAVGIGVLARQPAFTPPIKDENGQAVPDSLASLEKVYLGGAEQWILIRGWKASNPVLLFVHGGPGAAEMPYLTPVIGELEKHFVVVIWDQRGAGKSFPAGQAISKMKISQFVSDACELTRLLCERFQQKKIYLVGSSWGSVVGVLTMQKCPELYHAYVGAGQVVYMQENERISYEWVLSQAREKGDAATIRQLEQIGPPPYTGDWKRKLLAERRLLEAYGGEVYGSPTGAMGMLMKSLLLSTEYTLEEKLNYARGAFNSLALLWPHVMAINFLEQAPKLEVPVYFASGRHDYETPFELVERYYQVLEAPYKEMVWFEDSAHMPAVEEPAKFSAFLVEKVRQHS